MLQPTSLGATTSRRKIAGTSGRRGYDHGDSLLQPTSMGATTCISFCYKQSWRNDGRRFFVTTVVDFATTGDHFCYIGDGGRHSRWHGVLQLGKRSCNHGHKSWNRSPAELQRRSGGAAFFASTGSRKATTGIHFCYNHDNEVWPAGMTHDFFCCN